MNPYSNNFTDELNVNKHVTVSLVLLDNCRKINIFITIVIACIGLVGHFLTIYVYSKSRYRTNSGNVYMLCLAIVDGLFLIVHIFEDTIRTIKDTYAKSYNLNSILLLNIVDQNNLACCLVNYLRNVLRFISAYLILAFTVQRLFIVYKPLLNKFKSKKSAWLTFMIILLISLIINMWAPFMFEIQKDEESPYCDVNREWTSEYFIINACYMVLVMLIPILIIFICNLLIITKTAQEDTKRRTFKRRTSTNMKSTRLMFDTSSQSTLRITRLDSTLEHKRALYKQNRSPTFKQNYSKKLTRMLMFVSLSYVFLNLPYLISWWLFFTEMTLNSEISQIHKNNLFSMVQITEIFNILNYGDHFFVYCLSGSLFRNQLKSLFMKTFN